MPSEPMAPTNACEYLADFPALLFHISNFDSCDEIQLTDTNTKSVEKGNLLVSASLLEALKKVEIVPTLGDGGRKSKIIAYNLSSNMKPLRMSE